MTVSFNGLDKMSRVDTCTQVSYSGPDSPAASVSGSCHDSAGNESESSVFALKYDSTPPSAMRVSVTAGDRFVRLRWRSPPDTTLVEIVRSAGPRASSVTLYRGAGDAYTDKRLRNGVRYRYTITGYDDARNAVARSMVAIPKAPLFSPPAEQESSLRRSSPGSAWRTRRTSTRRSGGSGRSSALGRQVRRSV